MTNEKAKLFFEEFIGKKASDFFILVQSGSARINFVGESSNQKYIITFNENVAENESFFYFSQIFTELKLNTPKIFQISEDRKIYIQEFLGEQTLSEIIEKDELSAQTKALVKKTLLQLFNLQTKTEGLIDYSETFEYEMYNEFPILNDLFYFKSFIVDVLEIPYHKSTLLLEFKNLISRIENLEPKGLMIRDFQARNIMVDDHEEIHFIDYQSAMKGPLIYDVVSFLFQAKANFSSDFKEEMLNYYFSLWNDEEKVDQLKIALEPIQLIRFLQVLGAYGFRGLIQQKPHFIASIDLGIENLFNFMQNWDEMKNYPELMKIVSLLKSDDVKSKIDGIIFKN
jgi:aminoglycoside/choline kinase family phosphotransferase